MSSIDLKAYKAVSHARQFDEVPTFYGRGSGPYSLTLDVDAVQSIEQCLGQENDPRHRAGLLDDFFTVTLVGGEQHHIDSEGRNALVAAMNG